MAELTLVGLEQQSADWSKADFVIDSTAECVHVHTVDVPVQGPPRSVFLVVKFCTDCGHYLLFDISESGGGFLGEFKAQEEL